MPLVGKPKIVEVKTILENNKLRIPPYQRPYKWSVKNVSQLIDDILFHKGKPAYRLGTLVIHQDKNGDQNIVDGQQRALTLTLIAHAIQAAQKLKAFYPNEGFKSFSPTLLDAPFSHDISQKNLILNYREIERRIHEFDEGATDFFFHKCELVVLTLDDIGEAFQFFDSQNSRGKDLEPHDLLKAFHLREMACLPEEEKRKSVESWEAMKTGELADLFGNYLFRIRSWSKGKPARYFSKKEVGVFKGISPGQQRVYPFEQLYRIGDFYMDQYISDSQRQTDLQTFPYSFQIDQHLLNGKRFFEMVGYFKKMLDEVKALGVAPQKDGVNYALDIKDGDALEIFNTLCSASYKGRFRTGDKYTRMLFDCCLLYYFNKFGTENAGMAIKKIFIWAYTLRLNKQAVRLASVDNYARGKEGNPKLLEILREAIDPKEIMNLRLPALTNVESKKTDGVEALFRKLYYLP